MKVSQRDPLSWIDGQVAELEAHALRRELGWHAGAQSAVLNYNGREVINFGSNDYLGLAGDARLVVAATAALAQQGCGSGASPLVTGRSEALARLEQRLAAFDGTESALVFASGYAANVGTISALAGPGDAIYSDAKNHASIIDGCRLSRAQVHVYPHNDAQALESLLENGARYRRRLIVTESIFSMDGDRAPLAELAELAAAFDCMLLVDEAHATGVLGKNGRGLSEELAIEDWVHVRVGTLSKALGCVGGFACGSSSFVEWLVNRARAYVFSTALPPAICAAATAAIEIVESEPRRRAALAQSAAELANRLRQQGWRIGASASQIIPLHVGQPAKALWLSSLLQEFGLLVPAIRPPSVPLGQSLLRISLTSAHTPEMIGKLTDCLGHVVHEFRSS